MNILQCILAHICLGCIRSISRSMSQSSVPTIGVLAIQGNFQQNIAALQRVRQLSPNSAFRILDVRDAKTLSQCGGLLIPGGESTAMGVQPSFRSVATIMSDFISQLRFWTILAYKGIHCWMPIKTCTNKYGPIAGLRNEI